MTGMGFPLKHQLTPLCTNNPPTFKTPTRKTAKKENLVAARREGG
jgi:hypothetical protein